MKKYQSYVRYQSDKSRRRITALVASSYEEEQKSTNEYNDDLKSVTDELPKKKRRKKKGVMARKNEDGELEVITPQQSSWYQMYVNNVVIEEEMHYQNKFRTRFRLPYPNYLELVEDCKKAEHFERWQAVDATGKAASPIELLVLGALRYLGRGWTFDDLEESTAVSQDVHRVFFHVFIGFGSTVLYERYVIAPMNFEEAKRHMVEFTEAGLPGNVASADCCHVTSQMCEYNLRNNHLGPKSTHTTRTFSVSANHRKRVLHSTKGGPGRWNDQTMVRFDQFLSGIKDGEVLEDVEFEMYERDQNGDIITVKYRGGYVIVDNGYLRWSVTVPPFKVTNKETEIRWSKWVESMRKDVECTFGILKGRWRILKTGVRVHGVDAVDNIWLTCCALHNWLLDIDGLDEKWENGIQTSDWTGEMGNHDFEGIDAEIPNAIARLSTNLEPRNYDLSGMGPGEDEVDPGYSVLLDHGMDGAGPDETEPGSEVRVVNTLGLGFFRSRLVEHFDILWQQNAIKWPSRRGRPGTLT